MLSRSARTAVAFILATILLLVVVNRSSLPGRIESISSLAYHHSVQSVSQQQQSTTGSNNDVVDWSRFAYTQYVTNSDYLCNSVMIFEALHRLGSKADRVMMYPNYMMKDPSIQYTKGRNKRLLLKARDEYGVKLVPIDVQHRDNQKELTWADSYTKLLAFNQTQYDRVLSIDSDSVLLQHMDELFLIPSCPVAMPRAYWLFDDNPPKKILGSQLILLEPSAAEFQRIVDRTARATDDEFDMEIMNDLYKDSALVLPHRPYAMLTAEFRRNDHKLYLGSDAEKWDPKAVLAEVKNVHFSDWPVPKPWEKMSRKTREEMQPKCVRKANGEEDCTSREIWNGLYTNFTETRARVCAKPPDVAKIS